MAITVAALLAAPQQANAQFLKQLGKAVGSVGKSVLDATTSTTTTTTTTTTTAGTSNLTVNVTGCRSDGENVLVEMKLQNRSNKDVNATLIASAWGIKAQDNLGNTYERDIFLKIGNKPFTDVGEGVMLPSGLAMKVQMIIKNVDTSATSIAQISNFIASDDLGLEKETIKLRNIPINREPGYSTSATATTGQRANGNIAGAVSTGNPYLKCNVLSCRADGNDVTAELTLLNTGASDVNVTVCASAWGAKVYDSEGNIYERDIFVKVGNMQLNDVGDHVQLVSGLPTKVILVVKNVARDATSLALITKLLGSDDLCINSEALKIRNVPITR